MAMKHRNDDFITFFLQYKNHIYENKAAHISFIECYILY